MRKITFFVGLLSCLVLFKPNQSFSQGTFSGHLGLAVPSSSFADYSKANDFNSAAALGLNVGVKYDYPLSENGLGLFVGLDVNYNGIQKTFRDDYGSADAFPKYLSIPVSGGISYTHKVNDKVALFGKGGLVASYLKKTELKDSNYGNIEFLSSTNLGYTIGVGAWLNSKIEFAVSYMGLGERSVNNYDDNGVLWDSYKQKVGLTTLTVGYKF